MRSVYQSAGRVLIWLGPSFENSDRAGAFLKIKGEEIQAGERAGGSIPVGSFPPDAVKAVYDLMRRPYWYRVWILQEVSLSLDDPLIGCGCWRLPWDTFRSGILHIYAYLKAQELQIRQGEPIDAIGLDHWRTLSYTIFRLDQVRRDAAEGGAVPNPWRDGRSLPKSPGKSNFLELLRIGALLDATDPRDHIYGLLGLANCKTQVDIGISPDYTKSTSLVFLEAFKAAVEIENNLEVLNLRNHLPCSPLPSWVPTSLVPHRFVTQNLHQRTCITGELVEAEVCGIRYQATLKCLRFKEFWLIRLNVYWTFMGLKRSLLFGSITFTRWPPLLLARIYSYYLITSPL
jgi:hypothetical protein